MKRITRFVKSLDQNEIFVFGSNEGGKHGKGAALQAKRMFGAKWGQAEGLQGNSYGIPTKDKMIKKTLSLAKIKKYVETFIIFAKNNKQYVFLVTEIGCGLAGLNPDNIAPMFKDAYLLDNVYLPKKFVEKIEGDKK